MNLENIENLIQDIEIKKPIMKIVEFEQSQLDKTKYHYKEEYNKIIEEFISYENNENKDL